MLVAAVIIQSRRSGGESALERVLDRSVRSACDVLVGSAAVSNVLLVGAGVGAYGWRTVRAMVPHGPLELSAFSLALATYLCARRGALTRRMLLECAVAGLVALSVGAVLEVFAGGA
jgi:hypothetical protein